MVAQLKDHCDTSTEGGGLVSPGSVRVDDRILNRVRGQGCVSSSHKVAHQVAVLIEGASIFASWTVE